MTIFSQPSSITVRILVWGWPNSGLPYRVDGSIEHDGFPYGRKLARVFHFHAPNPMALAHDAFCCWVDYNAPRCSTAIGA